MYILYEDFKAVNEGMWIFALSNTSKMTVAVPYPAHICYPGEVRSSKMAMYNEASFPVWSEICSVDS